LDCRLRKKDSDMTCYFFPVRLRREVAGIQHVDLDVLEIASVWSRPRLAGTNARVVAKYRCGRNFGGEGCGIVARQTKRGTTAGKQEAQTNKAAPSGQRASSSIQQSNARYHNETLA
jgi:hypothetical protein